ncbi:hypothetical protein Pfo_013123 [Paulownia fortunei]|nr:hypothetical protein Pfo_013123 [Paulownia fortunei]
MADLHGGFSSGGGMAALDTEDFQEEEVWAMMKARDGSNSKSKSRKNSSGSSSSSSAWRFTATSRTIPRATSGGHLELPATARAHQSSAPVNIPDWSKILKKKPKKNLWDDACDAHNDDGGGGSWKFHHVKVDDFESDDADGDGDDMLPPHEYLARRIASTQIASFSMCEGVGRTLKGRDLSNLRNAILTKTGFLE